MQPRKSLSDILRGDEIDSLANAWQTTVAAGEFAPLPTGEYDCRVLSGELFKSNAKGTPGYKITFEVTAGEYVNRRIWHDAWLTPAAMPRTKRDLGKLGVTDETQLELPLPQGILARVKLSLRKEDDGTTYNRVRSFEVIGVEPPDEFAPKADANTDAGPGDSAFGANAVVPQPAKPVPPAAATPAEKSRAKAARPKKPPATLFPNEAIGGDQDARGPYEGDRR